MGPARPVERALRPPRPPARITAGDERLRIALSVNDTVIRHLFSIGLDLHAIRTMVPTAVQARLEATVDELDAAIRELRSLIFDLEADS